MSPVMQRLEALDRALVAKGWVPLSEWWLATFAAFVASGVRQLVARVGRRGGKSSSLCRLCVAFALAYDCTSIPPGDLGVVAFFSTRQAEASSRLRTIKGILDAIGAKWKPIDGGIELVARPIAFVVYPATVTGALGFTSVLIIADEVAAWRDAATGANPATEALAAVRPTMASQSAARIVLSSSARGLVDAHAKAFAEGDTSFQRTAFAPSWVANPTLNEAQLRAEEPSARVFEREYAGIPQSGPIQALNPAHFDRCVVAALEGYRMLGRPVVVNDLSSGGGDAATWMAFAWCAAPSSDAETTWTWDDAGEPVSLAMHDVATPSERLLAWEFGALDGRFREQLSSSSLVGAIARSAHAVGAHVVIGDQLAEYFASGEFRRNGLRYESIAWTNARKVDAVATLRRWMRDRTLAVVDGDHVAVVRAEVAAFAEKITASGSFKYEGAGGAHDDRVALLLGAAMAEAEGLLEGSPHRIRARRHELLDHVESEDA